MVIELISNVDSLSLQRKSIILSQYGHLNFNHFSHLLIRDCSGWNNIEFLETYMSNASNVNTEISKTSIQLRTMPRNHETMKN